MKFYFVLALILALNTVNSMASLYLYRHAVGAQMTQEQTQQLMDQMWAMGWRPSGWKTGPTRTGGLAAN